MARIGSGDSYHRANVRRPARFAGLSLLIAAALGTGTAVVYGQEYPAKPVRVVLGCAAGGSTERKACVTTKQTPSLPRMHRRNKESVSNRSVVRPLISMGGGVLLHLKLNSNEFISTHNRYQIVQLYDP